MAKSVLQQMILLKDLLMEEPCNSDNAQRIFLEIWRTAPQAWKSKCQIKVIRDPIQRWKMERITLSPCMLSILNQWNNDPSSFFWTGLESSKTEVNMSTRIFQALDDVIQTSAMVLRILHIALYALARRLQIDRSNKNEERFLELVHVAYSFETKSKKFKRWTALGKKYESLATDLGGWGAMIILPEDVSTYQLERLPEKGPTREKALEILRERGINDMKDKDISFCFSVGRKLQEAFTSEFDSCYLQYNPDLGDDKTPHTGRKRKREQTPATPPSKRLEVYNNSDENDNVLGAGSGEMTGSIIQKELEPATMEHATPCLNTNSTFFDNPSDISLPDISEDPTWSSMRDWPYDELFLKA